MSCSTLRERADGSPPNTSQVSLQQLARYQMSQQSSVICRCLYNLLIFCWPLRVKKKNFWSCPEGCAAPSFVPCQCYTWKPLSKLERTSPPVKINVTSKSPVGDIAVVTLIRTDTTLDRSQKAEKVCITRLLTKRRTKKNILSRCFDSADHMN